MSRLWLRIYGFKCPNCGENLTVQKGHFQRFAPEGTIDVTAIEVPSQRLEE